MPFPYCQFGAGTETTEAVRNRRPCRALPTFVVAETDIVDPVANIRRRGWFELGEFCTGHAITVAGIVGRDGRWTRAMRPLPATVEVHGKH